MINVCGADAIEFLQGQLTQDVSLLATEPHLLAAWCTAKGRVIVMARLASIDDGVAMVVPADMADKVLQTLLMYRFRSRVDLAISDNDGGEWLEPQECDPLSLIQAGIPHIDSLNSEAFTPHMLNLDKLGAISFTKGCYTGQEIVARTEHRGKSRRRMMHYLADLEGISVGATVSDGDRSVGEVVNVAGTELLAVTPVDRHAEPLRVDDIVIRPQGLPYGL